jgi:hypothetical protein
MVAGGRAAGAWVHKLAAQISTVPMAFIARRQTSIGGAPGIRPIRLSPLQKKAEISGFKKRHSD